MKLDLNGSLDFDTNIFGTFVRRGGKSPVSMHLFTHEKMSCTKKCDLDAILNGHLYH
jgi:hypothetical protein